MKPLSSSQRELLQRAAAAYNTQLDGAQEVRDYLGQRGFVKKTGERFQLGAVVEPFIAEHERFVGSLVIPNICAAGEHGPHVVGLKFRYLGNEKGHKRYDQPAGQVARLFHLRAIQEAGSLIVLTEGEIDCMTVDMIGLPCIGVPGAQSWGKAHRNRLLAGFERVILIRDADDAGEDLVRAVQDVENLEIRIPPDGVKDTNELWCKTRDAEAIREWILTGKT